MKYKNIFFIIFGILLLSSFVSATINWNSSSEVKAFYTYEKENSTHLKDWSPNSNHALLFGTGEDIQSNYINFNGGFGYESINIMGLSATGDHTICVWVDIVGMPYLTNRNQVIANIDGAVLGGANTISTDDYNQPADITFGGNVRGGGSWISRSDSVYNYLDSGLLLMCVIWVETTTDNILLYKNGTSTGVVLGTDYSYSDHYITLGSTEDHSLKSDNVELYSTMVFNKHLSPTEINNLVSEGVNFNPYYVPASNFTITLKNHWNNSNLINFSAIVNGTLYNDSGTGTITTPIQTDNINTFDILLLKDDYFNQTINNVNASVNNSIIGNISQSIIKPLCYEKITNHTIICTNTTIYPNAETINLTITSNGYYDIIQEETIIALDNKTIDFINFYYNILNITAITYGSVDIDIFNITITNDTYSETLSTTDGYIEIGLINGTYNLSINANNYELKYTNIIIENVSQVYEFQLYTTNSLSISIYDEETLALITTNNITLDFISSVFSSNYSTSNGTLYIDLLSPTLYTLRYKSLPTYSERFYYFNLLDRTHTNLNLYLLNNSDNITLVIYDENANFIENAYIEVLKYNIITNSYELKEIVTTNFEGEANFLGELFTEFYKFNVEYPFGNLKETTTPAYLTDTTLNINIILNQGINDDYSTVEGVTYALIFNEVTNNFKFNYNDATNIAEYGCLYIYSVGYIGNVLYNSTCLSGASGEILLNVVNTSGVTYLAKGYVSISNQEYFIGELFKNFNEFLEENKNLRMFLIALLTLIFAFLGSSNIVIALALTPLPLFFGAISGFINISYTVVIPIILGSITLIYLVGRKS